MRAVGWMVWSRDSRRMCPSAMRCSSEYTIVTRRLNAARSPALTGDKSAVIDSFIATETLQRVPSSRSDTGGDFVSEKLSCVSEKNCAATAEITASDGALYGNTPL